MKITFETDAPLASFRIFLHREIINPRRFAGRVGATPRHIVKYEGFGDVVSACSNALWHLRASPEGLSTNETAIGLYERDDAGHDYMLGVAWEFVCHAGLGKQTRVNAECKQITLPAELSPEDNPKIAKFMSRIEAVFIDMMIAIVDELPETANTIFAYPRFSRKNDRISEETIKAVTNAFKDYLDGTMSPRAAADKHGTSEKAMKKYIGNALAFQEPETTARWKQLLEGYGWEIKPPLTRGNT